MATSPSRLQPSRPSLPKHGWKRSACGRRRVAEIEADATRSNGEEPDEAVADLLGTVGLARARMVEKSQLVSVRYARRPLEDTDDTSTDGLSEVVGINRGNDVEDLDLRNEARVGERHLQRPSRATTCMGLSGR